MDTISDVSGLREGVQALPPSVARLRLQPGIEATRGAGEEGGGCAVAAAWQLRQRGSYADKEEEDMSWYGTESIHAVQWDVGHALGVCAAFDRPGLPCSLEGALVLLVAPPAEANPEALGAYLGQCAELAGRLGCDSIDGLALTLKVDDSAAAGAGMADDGGGGGFLGRVLGAVLPGAAPFLQRLRVLVASGTFPPRYSRHLVTPPGLAFPLLEELELHTDGAGDLTMAGADVAALCRLAAPRLGLFALLAPLFDAQNDVPPDRGMRLILGPTGQPCAESAVSVLAACWPPREGGRTTTIRVGCGPPDKAEGAAVALVLQAVAGEGAAEHARVEWGLDMEGWE